MKLAEDKQVICCHQRRSVILTVVCGEHFLQTSLGPTTANTFCYICVFLLCFWCDMQRRQQSRQACKKTCSSNIQWFSLLVGYQLDMFHTRKQADNRKWGYWYYVGYLMPVVQCRGQFHFPSQKQVGFLFRGSVVEHWSFTASFRSPVLDLQLTGDHLCG